MTKGKKQKEEVREFPLKYGVKIGHYKIDPDDEETWCVADAIVYIPIQRKDAANSLGAEKEFACYTIDGHAVEPIPDFELFQVFVFMAKILWESGVLKPWQIAIVQKVIEQVSALAGQVSSQGTKKIIPIAENKRKGGK